MLRGDSSIRGVAASRRGYRTGGGGELRRWPASGRPGRLVASSFLAAALLLVVAGLPAAAARPVSEPALGGLGAAIPGSYVVLLRSGAAATVATEHAALGARVGRLFPTVGAYAARMSPAVAAAVAADPRVRSVTPDRVYREAAQSVPTGIDRVEADVSSVKAGDGSGPGVDADIAVLDTGIDVEHPDLNVAGGVNCVKGLLGGDSYDDGRGHGTHIAGIAAAKDDAVGVVGVAPGARVWAVRVLDSGGGGSLATLICGIDWVTAHADVIDVANMSLTGPDPGSACADDPLHKAICASVAAGVTYTVAAGNNGADAKEYSPAAYPEVITVSALADFDGKPGGLATSSCAGGVDDRFAEFSNFGPAVDLIAPGLCIRSTWLDGKYATLTGTSQSAAHVAGAAALYLSEHKGATPAEVRKALIAAGSSAWATKTDPDGVPEPLLDVAKL
jgi:subtilisin